VTRHDRSNTYLRNPPLKSDFDYRVLHLLWPYSLIYCVDFGLKPLNFAKATDEDKEKRVQLVYERVERVLKLAPFNGATEISPLVTAYRYNTLAVENNMGDIVAHTVRLFPDIKTIYLDLGMELGEG